MHFVTFNSKVDEILREYAEELLKQTQTRTSVPIEEIRQKILDVQESVELKKEIPFLPDYKKIMPRFYQYYYSIPRVPKAEDYFFVYTPAGVSIQRVPQQQLGNGVLGVAYPGLGVIKIADHLFGLDFEEVKKHEINHILYPSLTEHEIRQKTKNELPFQPRYH